MYRAAIRLALTPAPDLHALLVKIEIIHEHELETHEGMSRNPFDVLREDVGRLSAS